MFLRDADRLADCRKRLNLCPLGSGAVAGATLPLDRGFMAEELEFSGPTANSMDATSDRDFVVEFVNALSLLGLHLSRWAEEMIIFSSQEFGFVQLPEAYSTGSSAMPQKKNPDLLELVRGKTGQPHLFAGGILIASGVMYVRLAILLALFNRQLMMMLWAPFLVLAALAVGGGWLWTRCADKKCTCVAAGVRPKIHLS